ncbi:MAG: hypothetical protein AAFP17_02765 [Pseudomonadota bacterium]
MSVTNCLATNGRCCGNARRTEDRMLDMVYYAVAAAGLALYGALMALALS